MKICEICGKKVDSKIYDYCKDCMAKRVANSARLKKIRRVCLKCDREFLATGRFNRICPQCQELNRNVDLHSFTIGCRLQSMD